MNPLSLDEIKAKAMPKPKMKVCSECNKEFPIYDFPVKSYGLKTTPGPSCKGCVAKRKQPKVEPEIVGKSESKPILKSLNDMEEAVKVSYDEDEGRSRECKQCGEIKDFEDFDTSDTICIDCVDENNLLKKLEAKDKEPQTKKCNKCQNILPLTDFGFDNEQDKIKDICKTCEKTIQIKSEHNKITKKSVKRNSKICPDCEKDKPFKEFYVDRRAKDGYVTHCKECMAVDRKEKNRIKAEKLFKSTIVPFCKHQKLFTLKDVCKKIAKNESTAWTHLTFMVKLGLLKVTKKGRINYYEIAKPVKSSYEDITDALPKPEIKESAKVKPDIPNSNVVKPPMDTSVSHTVTEKQDTILIQSPMSDEQFEALNKAVEETIKPEEDAEFKQLLMQMWNIRSAKRQDYNAGSMNNFELCDKLFGVEPHLGILVRMADKLSRLGSFVQKDYLAVTDESVEDTLLDLANYSLLCIVEYRKSKGLSK